MLSPTPFPGSTNLTCFSSQPENILTPTCIIGAVTWEVEEKVKRSLPEHPAPSSCPSGNLFVSPSLCSQVLQ